jgi:enterochelin esterase-like enzyme
MGKIISSERPESNPIITGDSVTFVWHGASAPALISDLSDWEINPQTLEQAAPDQWVYQTRIPEDAYIEYAFLDLETEQRIPDPLNPRTCSNGFGDNNHYFYMPGASPSPLTRRQRGVPKGALTRTQLATEELFVGRQRSVYLYQPPTDGPCPLLVVFDGQDYVRRGKLIQIVDTLIAQGRIQPIALALIYHGGKARFQEYACSEATLGFLDSAVLPLARKQLNLIDLSEKPGGFAVLGASMGGLMALYAGLRMPEIFGQVLSQSGAFRLFGYQMVVMDLARHFPLKPLNIWMDVGRFEFLLQANRDMYALLVDRGYEVSYREYPGGHNYTSWRNDIWRGLEHIFGTELK